MTELARRGMTMAHRGIASSREIMALLVIYYTGIPFIL
jgi:hypothetical protein